jgi:oligoendopeptidase F
MTPGSVAREMVRTGPRGGFNADQKRELREMVWQRRLAAWSWSTIARDLDITTSYAQTLAKEYVADRQTDRDVARGEEQERLDAMERVLLEAFAKTHDPKLVDTLLKITDRRARMLGLDDPTRTEAKVSVEDGPDVDTDAILREAMATAGMPRDDDAR